MAIRRFYWLIPDVLAGCSRPGGDAGGSANLHDDLSWLRGQGIGALLSLTELPVPEDALDGYGLSGLHLPVPDLTAPTPQQFLDALAFIDQQRLRDRATAVHCRMGEGRTGAILAAHLIRAGMGPEEALRELRALCPGAVGSPGQERALEAFAARRDWVI
jgi:atypical dual specificity phosphatase